MEVSHEPPTTEQVVLEHPAGRPPWKRILITGLVILVPVVLTVQVLWRLFLFMDGIFAPVIDQTFAFFLERDVHIPGLGLALTFLLVFAVGWLSTKVLGHRLILVFEQLVRRIPVASSIYSATKGVLKAISQDRTEAFKRVVLIQYPREGIFAMAFVTGGAEWGGLGPKTEDLLLVFVPTTPNPTSGFLLMVPRQDAIDLPFTVEEGIRIVISGGVLLPGLYDKALQRPSEEDSDEVMVPDRGTSG